MARRVANNTGEWNYQQQYPPQPNVHHQYGQQYATQSPHMNAPPKNTVDPWNWGWEDSNGGSESSNNNSQKDPTWDWSVDQSGSVGYQETVPPSNGATYAQPMWTGGYHQQYPPAFAPPATNSHDVISDSFNSFSVVNQHPYGHGQPTMFNSMEERHEVRHQNAHSEQQDIFYNNNHSRNQNQSRSAIANQSQLYFSGFHPPGGILGPQSIQNEGLGSVVGENRVLDERSNIPFDAAEGLRGKTVGESIEVPRDSHNRNAPHITATSDVLHQGQSSSQALSPQWSTESLPSQGSDETSLTTDNSARQSDTSTTPHDAPTPQSLPGGHKSCEVSLRSDIEQDQDHGNKDLKHSELKEYDEQTAYSPQPSKVQCGNEQSKEASVPFFNTPLQNFNRLSPAPSNSAQLGLGIKTTENSVDVPCVPFPNVDKVSAGLERLHLNSPHPDVENVEVAPPENSNPSVPPSNSSAPPVSAGTPPMPPPVAAPPILLGRNAEKGVNPYAAKGVNINHKYANKNLGRSHAPIPSPNLNVEPDTDSKNSSKSIPPISKTNKVLPDGEMPQTSSLKSQGLPSNVGVGFGSVPSPGRMPLPHQESVNLETLPDNKERPDFDVQLDRKSASPVSISRYHQTPVGQDAGVSHIPLWPQECSMPDNQEVYMDSPSVHQSSLDNFPVDSETAVRTNGRHRTPVTSANDVLRNPVRSELDRVVPGQGEENPQIASNLIQQGFNGSSNNTNVDDIMRRQIPGYQDTSTVSGQQSASPSGVEDISARAVPGGLMAEDGPSPVSLGSLYLHRTVPGQNSGGHQTIITNDADNPSLLAEDDTPPPGLSRMVPGESRGPEGQGGEDNSPENAPDEPRVVTGLAEESRQTVGTSNTNSSSFRPLPDEPRVVTGVAQDELDNSLVQLTSPVSTSSTPSGSSDGHEATDLDADGQDSGVERAQLPSERSETIGSDCVETFPAVSSDSMSRRDTESQRRNTDDGDAGSVDMGRHGNGREYFSSANSREREAPLDHTTESRRFRDDRDSRNYDRDHHLYERDQDKSLRNRYPYNRERVRYDEQEFGPHRPYDDQPRQGRRYKHLDDDEDEKEAYTSENEQKRKRDRERPSSDKSWYRDQDELSRYYNRRHREPSDTHSRDFRDRDHDRDQERDRERDRDWDRDRDRNRERDRERDPERERDRERNRDRDRDGDREKERERDRYYDRQYPYDRDYRRRDDYYGHFDDYYGQRSRPSSRSGSRPELNDERRRDYHQYAGYYYNPRAAYDEYSYRYYMAWQRYMQQHPHYQQQQLQHQQPAHASMSEDRGSVHSGRSSAHEELSRHHMERYQHSQYLPSHDYYYQQRPSSFTGDYDHRSTEHNVSMLEETTSSATPQRLTPTKFSTAHVKGLFTPSGQFVKILPHYPLDGQSATVELHDVCHILVPDAELTSFPGPLIKGVTHKKSLINFCTRKINIAEHNSDLLERDSMVLLWRLLLLLLRQNGMVVGTDIAELLLSQSSPHEISKTGSTSTSLPVTSSLSVRSASPASISGAECEGVSGAKPVNSKTLSDEELANTFREYLLYGNTHEALEWAMKYGLWGHALFLASKLGSRTYANVMTRFANGLTLNDPLQTLYQLMSGRLPAAVTCCADERWGDWKPHLAMILSNSSVQPDLEHRAIITLGDTLASRGCLYAAHFCYLMAQLEFGFYSQKSSKLVLIGSSHSKPFNIFANNDAIQMTEIYIYACQLADPEFDVPQFQIYKLLYAKRLVEAGMLKEALQYLEVVARTVTSRPTLYSIDFMQQVFELSNKLKIHDVSYAPDLDGEAEDLPWLIHLRNVLEDYMAGAIQPDGPSFGSTSNLSMSEGESAQPVISSISQQDVGFQSHQEQLQLEQQQQFSQQQALLHPQSQQQKITQQQLTQHPQQNAEFENQAKFGDVSLMSSEPGVTNLVEPGLQCSVQPVWNPQDYQREQNPVSEMRQDNDSYWSQNNWDKGVSMDNSNAVQQDSHQQNAQVGWDFQPTADKRDGGSISNEQTVGNGYSYHGTQTSNKMERPSGEHRSPLVTNQPAHKIQTAGTMKSKPKKETVKSPPASTRTSWFGGLWNKISLRPKNQMILPDDKEPKIVWNSDKQKWVNIDADDDEDGGDLPPPPKMAEVPAAISHVPSSDSSNGDVKMPPLSGQNIYKMNRSRGSRANYVDVFGGAKHTTPAVPAPEIFPNVSSTQTNPPANFFIPAPVNSDDNTPVDFLTAASESGGGDSSENAQQTFSAPMMFNPSEVNQFTAPHNSVSLSKKRYPN